MVGALRRQRAACSTTCTWPSADVDVLPDHRRAGHRHPAARPEPRQWARARDRRSLAAEVFAPVDEQQPGAGVRDQRHGFAVTIEDGMKVADLAGHPGHAGRRWRPRCAPYHQDYELRTVLGPDPRRAGRGLLPVQTPCSSPRRPPATRDVEDEVWDAGAGPRARGRAASKAGRRDVTTFALTRPVRSSAMTELFVNETMPHRGFQSGTLVVPEHRGHRLGLARQGRQPAGAAARGSRTPSGSSPATPTSTRR